MSEPTKLEIARNDYVRQLIELVEFGQSEVADTVRMHENFIRAVIADELAKREADDARIRFNP